MPICRLKDIALDAAYSDLPPNFREYIDGKYMDVSVDDIVPFWAEEHGDVIEDPRLGAVAVRAIYLLCYYYLSKILTTEEDLNVQILYQCSYHLAIVLDLLKTGQYRSALRSGDVELSLATFSVAAKTSIISVIRWVWDRKPPGMDEIVGVFKSDEAEQHVIDLTFPCMIFSDSGELCNMPVHPNQPLQEVLNYIARYKKVPLKTLRLSLLSGRRLFFTEIRKKTAGEAGLGRQDILRRESWRARQPV